MSQQYRQFVPNEDYLLQPEQLRKEYVSGLGSANYWGQRKLLLTVIQFLTYFWNPSEVPNPQVVYAGAGPGTNLYLVAKLFPSCSFHLYDPIELYWDLYYLPNVTIYQQLFTNAVARSWADRNDVFFISDIRSDINIRKDELEVNERKIMEDMSAQLEWYYIMRPVQAQLKFRLPYPLSNVPATTQYAYGYIFKQPYAKLRSTETRLVPIGNKEYPWDNKKYDDQMYFHNSVVRNDYYFLNPLTGQSDSIDGDELINNWDSTCEIQIIIDYLNKFGIDTSYAVQLSRQFTDFLGQGYHTVQSKRQIARGY